MKNIQLPDDIYQQAAQLADALADGALRYGLYISRVQRQRSRQEKTHQQHHGQRKASKKPCEKHHLATSKWLEIVSENLYASHGPMQNLRQFQ